MASSNFKSTNWTSPYFKFYLFITCFVHHVSCLSAGMLDRSSFTQAQFEYHCLICCWLISLSMTVLFPQLNNMCMYVCLAFLDPVLSPCSKSSNNMYGCVCLYQTFLDTWQILLLDLSLLLLLPLQTSTCPFTWISSQLLVVNRVSWAFFFQSLVHCTVTLCVCCCHFF